MKIIIGRGTVSHILDHFSEDGVPVGLCGEDGKRSICPVHFHGDVAKTDTVCPHVQRHLPERREGWHYT